MNCYYSNLIEGHNTHPVEIHKRDVQLEAKANIAVQSWIDAGGLTGAQAVTVEGICEIHRRFCELLPPELLSSASSAIATCRSAAVWRLAPAHCRVF